LWSIKKISKNKENLEKKEPFRSLDKKKKIILVTMHRRESFGKDMENICNALKIISANYREIQIVYPVHLNPNVREPVFKLLGKIDNIKLVDPLGYESFLWLMKKSYFIVTDSGGIQEEAPTLKKPVLVIRKKTERMESVDCGISKIVGTDTKNIIDSISDILDNEKNYKKMIIDKNPYGDGKASEKILDFILKKLR
jgi:UDP-N-acetylglucosamine 2-epimerase (non-hydrolysing)